jgi:hypothetical protein
VCCFVHSYFLFSLFYLSRIDDVGTNWVNAGSGILLFTAQNGSVSIARNDLLYYTVSPCIDAGTFFSDNECRECPVGAFCIGNSLSSLFLPSSVETPFLSD